VARVLILQGDCREVLLTLESQSVQCCVTSPPYWGLRDYGTATWEGGKVGCDHVQKVQPIVDGHFGDYVSGETTRGSRKYNEIMFKEICRKCGARRIDAQLGLEATPEEYIEKMVAVFREVGRVLRDDGTLWVNMGDSYAANRSYQVIDNKHIDVGNNGSSKVPRGMKPKDLCGIPWRLAFALQADGWYLRSDIIWAKPNPMPESVTDRPTKSHEYIFLLSKQERYFYDTEAIKEERAPVQGSTYSQPDKAARFGITTNGTDATTLRNRDDESRNKRTVWTVATQPYSEAHFATFPEDLIKPCILAGSKPGDTVLDPFAGSGTTGKVAIECGRSAILIELNPAYAEMARDRTNVTAGFF
jgi:DNA modification methylase